MSDFKRIEFSQRNRKFKSFKAKAKITAKVVRQTEIIHKEYLLLV
jgi:hypothetical protein